MNDTLKSRVSHCSHLISTPSIMNNLPLAQRRGNNFINGYDFVKVRLKQRMDDNDDEEEDDEDENETTKAWSHPPINPSTNLS